ncbi:MAG TPA: HAMP domain-containing sensor histidine kinase [Pseudonocardiaceae bacterium]|nr:HAMP domain-containing sensor histidine kinase [Pseudonocardiaceae bacterium]
MGLNGFRGRMVGLSVLTATLVVALLLLLTGWLLGRATDNQTRTLARTRAEAVAVTVAAGDGQVRLAEGAGEDRFDAVAWAYADGHLVDGSVPPEVAGEAARLSTATHEVFVTSGHYLLYAQPVPASGHQVTAVVMVDLAPYEASEQRSLFASLVLGGLAIALAGVVADVVVRRVVAKVNRMSALADDWSNQSSDRRFALGPPRDEFGELAQTLDRLLDRVAAAIADERRLTDEIAHELRTPLSVLRGEAQLAQLSGRDVDPQCVLTEVDRVSSAVTAILDAARSRPGSGVRCDVASALRLAAEGHDVEITAPGGVAVAVPAEVVTAVVSPLLDNAARHARSTVWITAHIEDDADDADDAGGGVVVRVLDDGPGFAPHETERVFEPGHTSGDGHGLGLAVVHRIAVAAGLQVRAVPDGRGHVRVRIPRERPPRVT